MDWNIEEEEEGEEEEEYSKRISKIILAEATVNGEEEEEREGERCLDAGVRLNSRKTGVYGILQCVSPEDSQIEQAFRIQGAHLQRKSPQKVTCH